MNNSYFFQGFVLQIDSRIDKLNGNAALLSDYWNKRQVNHNVRFVSAVLETKIIKIRVSSMQRIFWDVRVQLFMGTL